MMAMYIVVDINYQVNINMLTVCKPLIVCKIVNNLIKLIY